MLQHEIGHHKNHNIINGKITEDHLDAVLDSFAREDYYKYGIPTSKTKAELNTLDIPSKKKDEYTESDKQRASNLEKFKKYEIDNPHSNRTEFEADCYSSAHKNGDHLKRALRESNKHNNTEKAVKKKIKAELTIKKENNKSNKNMTNEVIQKITDDNIKNTLKHQRHITDIDYKQRSKALNDKSINKNVYREKDE